MLRQPLLIQKLGPSLGAKVRSGSDGLNGLCLHTLPWIIAVSETQQKDRDRESKEENMEIMPCILKPQSGSRAPGLSRKRKGISKRKEKKEGPLAARAGSARGNCLVPNTRTRYQQT